MKVNLVSSDIKDVKELIQRVSSDPHETSYRDLRRQCEGRELPGLKLWSSRPNFEVNDYFLVSEESSDDAYDTYDDDDDDMFNFQGTDNPEMSTIANAMETDYSTPERILRSGSQVPYFTEECRNNNNNKNNNNNNNQYNKPTTNNQNMSNGNVSSSNGNNTKNINNSSLTSNSSLSPSQRESFSRSEIRYSSHAASKRNDHHHHHHHRRPSLKSPRSQPFQKPLQEPPTTLVNNNTANPSHHTSSSSSPHSSPSKTKIHSNGANKSRSSSNSSTPSSSSSSSSMSTSNRPRRLSCTASIDDNKVLSILKTKLTRLTIVEFLYLLETFKYERISLKELEQVKQVLKGDDGTRSLQSTVTREDIGKIYNAKELNGAKLLNEFRKLKEDFEL